jgi:hypothetical protein
MQARDANQMSASRPSGGVGSGHSNQLQLGGAASVGTTNSAIQGGNRSSSFAARVSASSNGRLGTSKTTQQNRMN